MRQAGVLAGPGGGGCELCGLGVGVSVGFPYEDAGDDEREGGVGDAEQERCGAQPVFGGEVPGQEG